ncbi:MAG: hypothetical protein IKS23_00335 [Alphaproteobacteria bacterium]|nr:hypothetical protein [Alphaproteobacteria bacterium]
MRFLICFLILIVSPVFSSKAQEAESLEIRANACEKAIAGESSSSTRIRAVDKAVFLGLKNLSVFDQDKENMDDYDLNVMIYRILDEYVEDLSSKVTKSNEDKVCVQIEGYVNPSKINIVREEFKKNLQGSNNSNEEVFDIVQNVNEEIKVSPKNVEELALVYVDDLVYYNGSKSKKYANILKQKIENNSYYYLTEEKELADYVITPKILKAKVDLLDKDHKRLQVVLVLEVSGITQDILPVTQNRFLLFSAQESEQHIADRLIKKLLEAASSEAVRQIEIKETAKLEQNTLGRIL